MVQARLPGREKVDTVIDLVLKPWCLCKQAQLICQTALTSLTTSGHGCSIWTAGLHAKCALNLLLDLLTFHLLGLRSRTA